MIDYTKCTLKKYPTAILSDFTFQDNSDGNGVYLAYWNTEKLGAAPTLTELDTYWLAIVKTDAITEIKSIRRQGLDLAALSAGILAIYDANYAASVDFLNGAPDVQTKNGMTAEEYLTGFGGRLNMTATQFAEYIVAENLRVGPTAYDVEKRYLALCYGGDASAGIMPVNYLPTVDAVDQAVTNFRVYCNIP
jgi:hypothetical protein